MSKPVSKTKAENVRQAIINKYYVRGREEQEIYLQKPGDNYGGTDHWMLVWEGGPFEWALEVGQIVPGTFLEPYSSFALGIYPND
ncbi:hypothetical protein SEA_SONALI_98 [Arthrobacter phage Sonali]|uniref:Uncharacterized protein n=1 Tax=Arthrobacter phage Sonali TaxID=2510495 RepID=A0A411CQY3_9CAUD|nr:hypothetical protein HOV09_gp98 [Arthrobacter phage Sonali]QAY16210.1 hypothetical protein SEA_SONALI_98 [Arthrobacter phage Sonali]